MSYITEEELIPYQNIMDGLNMDDVRMATSLIDGYLGRSYELKTFRDIVKINKTRRGKLKHAPVAELKKAQIVYDCMFGREKMDANLEDIDLDPEMDGYFTYSGGYGIAPLVYGFKPLSIEVTYTSGFKEYPQRLKDACGMLACNIRQAKSFSGAKQLTSLDFQVMMSDDSFFTSDIKMLLKGLDSLAGTV